MAERPNPEKFVGVETTLPTRPLPPIGARTSISTQRLLLRPLEASDIGGMYALRQEEDVMKWTSEGRIDIDMNESQHKLDSFLPPNNATTMMYAICAKDTGDFLGIGGLTTLDSDMGWPTVGYLLNKAAWGKGYATEFLHAFLNMYRELPRSTGSLRVDPRTVAGSEEMEECVVAITVADNYKSQKVLEKCGFKHAMNWQGRRCPMSAFQYFIPSNMS